MKIANGNVISMAPAAEAVSPMGDTGLPVPTNERQARELGRIPEPQRAEVWRATVERTGGQPTAAAVREHTPGISGIEIRARELQTAEARA